MLQVPILRNIYQRFPDLEIIGVSVEVNDTYQDLVTYKNDNSLSFLTFTK